MSHTPREKAHRRDRGERRGGVWRAREQIVSAVSAVSAVNRSPRPSWIVTILTCSNRCKVPRQQELTMMRIRVVAALACVMSGAAALAQDARPTFSVGTATAKRGEKAYGV